MSVNIVLANMSYNYPVKGDTVFAGWSPALKVFFAGIRDENQIQH